MITIPSKNYNPGVKIDVIEVNGPKSYTTGGFTVYSRIMNVQHAVAVASNGYLAEVVSLAGSAIKIKIYQFNYPATAAGPAVEVPKGTDLSGIKITVIAIGQ